MKSNESKIVLIGLILYVVVFYALLYKAAYSDSKDTTMIADMFQQYYKERL